jgi:Methyltransferase domain
VAEPAAGPAAGPTAEPAGAALTEGLDRVRDLLLDDRRLVRAVAAGQRRGAERARWRRAELRYVDLKAGRRLQVTTYDATQAFTANHGPDVAAQEVDVLLAEPFGNWHVFAEDREVAVRVTKKGRALVHERRPSRDDAEGRSDPGRQHDREKPRLLPEDDPVLRALGISGEDGTVKPSRQAKYRQVEEFLRLLGSGLDDAVAAGALRTPTPEEPWLLVDLGCGNAYLTFAAHRWLSAVRRQPVTVVGVDAKPQSLAHNQEVASRLGVTDEVRFVQGLIDEVDLPTVAGRRPDVVMALHACDTATDDALAAAVTADAPLVLAAPCCHHDVAAQLRRGRPEERSRPAYALLLRDGILRERFADTLTDALRAAALRLAGYRVDVVEFVESRHTPRNTLLRAVRTGAAPPGTAAELEAVTAAWQVAPRLVTLLGEGDRPGRRAEVS